MHIHVLRHVPFEGAAIIASLCQQEGYEATITHLYEGETLPVSYAGIKLIVVMGGPMSVLDEAIYPWLSDEKLWLQQAICAGVRIMGVCLGAQLLATVLGGYVTRNPKPEIGWFPVTRFIEGAPWNMLLPERFYAFHWHGETFSLPPEAQLLVRSEACINQAFIWHEQVLGIQFHLEMTVKNVRALCMHCADDLAAGEWVQTEAAMLADHGHFIAAHDVMLSIIRYMLR